MRLARTSFVNLPSRLGGFTVDRLVSSTSEKSDSSEKVRVRRFFDFGGRTISSSSSESTTVAAEVTCITESGFISEKSPKIYDGINVNFPRDI